MNTPNPLVPQGTFAEKGKSHIRITVFAILAVHVVLLGLLLIAGCNRKPDATVQDTGIPPVPPVGDGWPPSPTSAPPATAGQPFAPVEPPAAVPSATPPVAPPVAPPAVTPPEITPPATSVASGLTEHTIVKGESFYTLGKKYGVGYKAIADANPNVNPTRLKIGDKIKIPAKSATPASPTAVALENGSGTRTYKVKSGDNLMKIAKSLGVSVQQLRTANNLRTDQIKVGQVLKIPAKAPAPAAPAAAEPPPAVPPPAVVPPPTGPQ